MSSNICIKQKQTLKMNHLQSAYPAPEPDFIEQLSKGNIPGYTSSPDAKVSTRLKKYTLTFDNQHFVQSHSNINIMSLKHLALHKLTYLVCSVACNASSQKEEGNGQGQEKNHQSNVQSNGAPETTTKAQDK